MDSRFSLLFLLNALEKCCYERFEISEIGTFVEMGF